MNMYNPKISSNSIRLLSGLLLAALAPISMSIAQAEEVSLYQKASIQLPYAANVSLSAQDAKASTDTLTWLLSNSVVENGVYSLNLTQSKQSGAGGKFSNVWGNFDLKLKFELLPGAYSQTTFPGISEPHFTKDELMTKFRVNRHRIMFTIGTSWQ